MFDNYYQLKTKLLQYSTVIRAPNRASKRGLLRRIYYTICQISARMAECPNLFNKLVYVLCMWDLGGVYMHFFLEFSYCSTSFVFDN
jgi:hypothetical protein